MEKTKCGVPQGSWLHCWFHLHQRFFLCIKLLLFLAICRWYKHNRYRDRTRCDRLNDDLEKNISHCCAVINCCWICWEKKYIKFSPRNTMVFDVVIQINCVGIERVCCTVFLWAIIDSKFHGKIIPIINVTNCQRVLVSYAKTGKNTQTIPNQFTIPLLTHTWYIVVPGTSNILVLFF